MMEPRKRSSDRLVRYDKVVLNVSSFIIIRMFYEVFIMFIYLQRLVDAVSKGDIDEMVALLTSGIDINITLEVLYVYYKPTPMSIILCPHNEYIQHPLSSFTGTLSFY